MVILTPWRKALWRAIEVTPIYQAQQEFVA